jgi:hypothetical protein
MPNTSGNDEAPRRGRLNDLDEDDTLREVGQDQEFELEDEVDPAERRRDPLRQPH